MAYCPNYPGLVARLWASAYLHNWLRSAVRVLQPLLRVVVADVNINNLSFAWFYVTTATNHVLRY